MSTTFTRYQIFINDHPFFKPDYVIADEDEARREFLYALDFVPPGKTVELVKLTGEVIQSEESS